MHASHRELGKKKKGLICVRKASNNKRYQKRQLTMQIPERFTELSIRLSEVLDDSGAGKDTVFERRTTYLLRECYEMIELQLRDGHVKCLPFERDFDCFHFGSQSEGTTIPGLQSDIDILISKNDCNIMIVWEDWKAGMLNFLMFQDVTTPPQQYLLQVIRRDTPEPETSLINDMTIMKDSGQILFSAERFKQDLEILGRGLGKLTKNGPSVSFIPNWDVVNAFPVRKPLPEIHHWIDRCRGKHWPPVQLLEAARVAPCFLVPAGHTDSDYKCEEWRLSPNLIERMLVFSFNMTQIKCYIVLKLMKKSLFAKIVGDSITSFHCKTIMFYTIERTPPSLWFEHNLMFLLWLCLHVLRRWLRLGRIPHYIIEGVNLFDGKVSRLLQNRLLVYINSLLRNNLQDVFDIGIDNIGRRLEACSMRHLVQAGELRGLCLRNSIRLLLKFECLERLLNMYERLLKNEFCSSHKTFELSLKFLIRYVVENSTNAISTLAALECIKHFYALQISVQSSYYLRLQNVIYGENIRRVQYTFNTDVASSRLKFASMLYCSGHLQAAVRVLEDVKRMYHSKVKSVCIWRYIPGDRDLQVFADMLSGNTEDGFSESPFALCVRFSRQEAYCTPFILLFEMKRNITQEEYAQRDYKQKHCMDCAEVDALPFLYYLQYITYGELGDRDNQLRSFRVLTSYTDDLINKKKLYHPETALNMLGHCFEMEGDYSEAFFFYERSLGIQGTNNAANWHVLRVLRLISG